MGGWPRILLLIAIVPVLIGVAAYLIETDEEAIERLMDECRQAALDDDVERIRAALEPGATAEGRVGEGELAPLVDSWLKVVNGRLRSASLSDEMIEVNGDDARAVWRVVATFRHGKPVPLVRLRLDVRYRRSPEGWRIRHVAVEIWRS